MFVDVEDSSVFAASSCFFSAAARAALAAFARATKEHRNESVTQTQIAAKKTKKKARKRQPGEVFRPPLQTETIWVVHKFVDALKRCHFFGLTELNLGEVDELKLVKQ